MVISNIILLTSIVFLIGLWGVLLNRRNVIILFMSLEIMYLAANINIAFYCFLYQDILGLVFIMYTLTIVGCESCVGLSIVSLYYAIHKDVSLNNISGSRS